MSDKKKMVVLSRGYAKQFKCDTPWAAISVSTEKGDFPNLSEENRVGLLRLCFWDIANPSLKQIEAFDDKIFSVEQAKQVLDFVEEVWDKVDTMMIHCEAGICRSPAIAAAIEYIKYGRDASMVYFNRYCPNSFVYKTLMSLHFGKGSEQSKDASEIVTTVPNAQVYEDPADIDWGCDLK